MILESIRRDAFARDVGLISNEGEVSHRGLAELLRSPLARWGLSPRSAILRHARDQLDAADLRERASQLVPKVLGRLLHLGECAETWIGHERYIAPASPRWIRTGEGSAALLSVAPVPEGIVEQGPAGSGKDIVRRIVVHGDDELAALRMGGVSQSSIDEWLTPHAYLDYARRRTECLFRSDELSLSKFWDLLVAAVREDGLPVGDGADFRAVIGKPGQYFGRRNAASCEGRWSSTIPDGIWCAYRRGYGQTRWHPIVMAVEDGRQRAMDLYNDDEWRWALVARGRNSGVDEHIERGNGLVRVTFPAPDQVVAAMDILGPRQSAWSWEATLGAPDPWAAII